MPQQSKKITRDSKRKRESSIKISESQTFEQELRDVASQEPNVPSESVDAALPSNATPHEECDEDFDERFEDNFDGIDWKRLPEFMKPLRTQKHKKSWIYRHGYRVCLRSNPDRIYFICRYCHQHKVIDAGGQGRYEVTFSTSTAVAYLQANQHSHNHSPSGVSKSNLPPGQKTLAGLTMNGIIIP